MLSETTYCDLNIEFAHVDFDKNQKFSRIKVESSIIAAEKALSKAASNGLRYVTSILIDDKQIPHPPLNQESVLEFLTIATSSIPVDYICFERSLPSYIEDMFELVDEDHRSLVRGKAEKYIKRAGRIGCSHDIAIWHLMRLGKITPEPRHVVPITAMMGKNSLSQPFFAKKAVSILSKEDEKAELRARDEILQFCCGKELIKCIENIYY